MGEIGITEIFLNESKEIIDNLESGIVTLEEDKDNLDIINEIFRYFHTLKGSSGIVGYTSIYEFTHHLESLFDKVRSGEIKVTSDIIDILLNSIDWIKAELFDDGVDSDSQAKQMNLTARINVYIKGDSEEQDKSEPQFTKQVKQQRQVKSGNYFFNIKASFKENIFYNGIDPLMIIEDLSGLGDMISCKIDTKNIPSLDELDPEKCYLSWEILIKTIHEESKIRDVFLFVFDDNDIEIEDVTYKYSSDAEGKSILAEKKLGEILIDKGIINDVELDEIVQYQTDTNYKIGDLIVEKGLASPKQVDEALHEQEKLRRRVDINTVRVDSNKLDNLMNLLGEIVIGQASLHKIAQEMDDERADSLKNSLYSLDRITKEFQEQIMSIRMVPIGPYIRAIQAFCKGYGAFSREGDQAEDRGW